MTFCEQSKQRLARDLRHGVPYCHVDGADSHGALAVATRFLIRHQRCPDFIWIEVVTAFVDQRLRIGFHQPWREPLSGQPTLSVTAVGVEAVPDDRLALAHDIGHDGNKARRHLGEVDIGVADRRGDRFGNFADVEDTNGHGFRFRTSVRCSCDRLLACRRPVQDAVLSRKYGSTGPWTLIVSGFPKRSLALPAVTRTHPSLTQYSSTLVFSTPLKRTPTPRSSAAASWCGLFGFLAKRSGGTSSIG